MFYFTWQPSSDILSDNFQDDYINIFLMQRNIRCSLCRLIYGVSVCSSVCRSDNRDFCTSKHLSRLCRVGFLASQKQKIKSVKPKEENKLTIHIWHVSIHF